MGLGMRIFGDDAGFGWRATTAILGVIAVALLVRVALRLFRSVPLAAIAGLAMALDGMGITLSRTGLLDNMVAFFVLAGFWAVLRDREYARERLAARAAWPAGSPDRVEAIDNKIKLRVRMGYGFTNIDNLIALVMLRCSNLPLVLPGRA